MKHLIILGLLFFLNLSVFADKKTPAEKAKEKTEEMNKDLQLSADQQKKIYDVNLKAFEAIDAYDAKKPSKKLKKKQKEIVQNMRKNEYKKILTPAQFKKMLDLKKQEKEKEKAEEEALEKSIKTKK